MTQLLVDKNFVCRSVEGDLCLHFLYGCNMYCVDFGSTEIYKLVRSCNFQLPLFWINFHVQFCAGKLWLWGAAVLTVQLLVLGMSLLYISITLVSIQDIGVVINVSANTQDRNHQGSCSERSPDGKPPTHERKAFLYA